MCVISSPRRGHDTRVVHVVIRQQVRRERRVFRVLSLPDYVVECCRPREILPPILVHFLSLQHMILLADHRPTPRRHSIKPHRTSITREVAVTEVRHLLLPVLILVEQNLLSTLFLPFLRMIVPRRA